MEDFTVSEVPLVPNRYELGLIPFTFPIMPSKEALTLKVDLKAVNNRYTSHPESADSAGVSLLDQKLLKT